MGTLLRLQRRAVVVAAALMLAGGAALPPVPAHSPSHMGLSSSVRAPPTASNCSGGGTKGVCLHNAMPILRSFSTSDVADCCGNCTATPKCISWNINTAMKQCFLRGSYKPNPGKECISGQVRPWAPPPPQPPAPPHHRSSVRDPHYDCQLRQIALDYTRDVVLRPWTNTSGRWAAAAALVAQGLKMEDCGGVPSALDQGHARHAPVLSTRRAHSAAASAAASHLDVGIPTPAHVYVYVATNGSDSSTGSASSPLRSIAGAQAWIRAKYPTVSARPHITVLVDSGDYFYGRAPAGHADIANSTRYSGTAQAHFSAEDSGASAASPISFAALHPEAPARFIGGLPLANLTWTPVRKTPLFGAMFILLTDE